MDCMEGMGQFPDNYFDLAIVDPPYGVGIANDGKIRETWKHTKRFTFSAKKYKPTNWDENVPDDKYFQELKRVSKMQIVWGGNFYGLGKNRCFIIWTKMKNCTNKKFSPCEYAWTSFDKNPVVYDYYWNGFGVINSGVKKIHPCQKPVPLYERILRDFGQGGWKILDTHVGSGSSLIACEREGFQYVGFEIDPDYYKAAKERIERERQQLTLALQ